MCLLAYIRSLRANPYPFGSLCWSHFAIQPRLLLNKDDLRVLIGVACPNGVSANDVAMMMMRGVEVDLGNISSMRQGARTTC